MAAPDNSGGFARELTSPIENAAAVSPSDTVNLTNASRALWVGVRGNVAVHMIGATISVVFVGVHGLLPIRVDKVLATNTDATSIVTLW